MNKKRILKIFNKTGDYIFFIILLVIPLIVTSPYIISVAITIGIYSIIALGLGLLLGYAGQISMGQAAFFGIGAYTSAILTTRFGFSTVLALICSIALSAVIAFLVGFPIFRLRGYFLALATLGFNVICYIFFNEAKWLTKGQSGITGVPYFSLFGLKIDSFTKYYYLTFIIFICVFLFTKNIINSKIGRAFKGISSSENAAASLGINSHLYKLIVFVIAGAYAGVAGSLYCFHISAVSPPSFQFFVSILIVMMVVIGGSSSIYGPIAGATVITILSEFLKRYQEYSLSIYGAAIILILIFIPDGLTKGISFRKK